MNKISEEQLWEYVSEVGESEKEFRKYSFSISPTQHTIRQEDIDELAEYDMDASDFLNVHVSRSGLRDDSWGTEWDSKPEYYKVEDYEEVVPEVIIPEHTVTKQRYTAFKPEFGE